MCRFGVVDFGEELFECTLNGSGFHTTIILIKPLHMQHQLPVHIR